MLMRIKVAIVCRLFISSIPITVSMKTICAKMSMYTRYFHLQSVLLSSYISHTSFPNIDMSLVREAAKTDAKAVKVVSTAQNKDIVNIIFHVGPRITSTMSVTVSYRLVIVGASSISRGCYDSGVSFFVISASV